VHGIPAVLLAVPRPNLLGAAVGSLSDDSIYEEIASETVTPIIGNVLSDVLAKNSLKSDPIHPNAEGYRQVEAGLRQSLQELGFVK
jgi:acyl-CoA hydrolase